MASRRSHVSSGSDNDDDTRFADAAPAASCQPRFAVARIGSFATAVLLHRLSCLMLWDFLFTGERKALVSTCKEADSWCLRHVRAHGPQTKRRRCLSDASGRRTEAPGRQLQAVAAPSTPDPLQGLLQVLERKVDRLANDLLRVQAFFRNRHSLLDSRLAQISTQLDALREHVFVSPAAVRVQPDLHDVFDLNCPQHIAEQAIQDSAVLLRAVRYHESRLDSFVGLLDDVQAAVRRR